MTRLTSSRIRRSAALAGLTARGAARVAAANVTPGRGRAARKQKAVLRTAEDVTRVMGEMKGVAMKIGQIVSLMGGAVPEGFADRLASLQSEAPPMAPQLVEQVFQQDLGRGPWEVFHSFEPEPFAAASIGQVHRARLHDGTRVAVKVQYPGVREAIGHDLANLGAIFGLIGLAAPGFEPGPFVDEIRRGIFDELDYARELRNQARFGEIYAGHPFIHIPRVYPESSTGRILVQELVTGRPLRDARAMPQADRDRIGEILFRFTFGSMHRHGLFQADPHAGNYLLQDDGTVTFLDFGCVAEFTETLREQLNGIVASVIKGDIAGWRRGMVAVGYIPPDLPFSDAEVWEHMRLYYSYVVDDGVEFTPELAAQMVRQNVQLTGEPGKLNRQLNIPPELAFTQRINFGFAGLMAGLRARGPWHSITAEYVLGAPPATDLGRLSAARSPDWV